MNCLSSLLACSLVACLLGCSGAANDPYAQMEKEAMERGGDTPFWDNAETNAKLPMDINELTFVDTTGEQVQMTDYLGKKNVVLVITRGFSGRLCPFCRTQSSRLVANYEEFAKRDAEILLVYPGDQDHLEEFVEAAKTSEKKEVDEIPFPILLDADLKAVNFLQIAADLAFPSTYILDKEGKVHFAYVGEAPNDRPSVKALLGQLDLLAN